ncbi:Apyrase [Capsicum baccatum]|uniref:Apyrase n=1 Tax=Capsicum baccatum TaxID=33114 RepID=A0A2G2XFE6_CAPBA|nr:Apyrase [Capsicum baccatum]
MQKHKNTNIHLLIVLLILVALPLSSYSRHDDDYPEKYAVIFDAGSTGSRVHVFRFNPNMELLNIANDLEFFLAIKPGLSSYAEDPRAAANSLKPLLEKAEAVVPKNLHTQTPIKIGATAGLRLLKGDASEKILQAVRDLLKNETTLSYKDEWISVLEGNQEGSYFWVALNYLYGNLGKNYSGTIATIDLGGGSVQIAYAVSKQSALNAPKLPKGEPYVQQKSLLGTNYYLYVHSFLNYGLLAARAEILKASKNSTSPCIVEGHDGYYTYNGVAYKAAAQKHGPSVGRCKAVIRKLLQLNAPCKHDNCSFAGVWNGGGGAGTTNLHVSSFFYDFASVVGIVDPKEPSGISQPIQYYKAAKLACQTKKQNMKLVFPNIGDKDIPFICMDLMYEYTLLVDGFGIDPYRKTTFVHQVKYKDHLVEAAWPLGSAIDVVSSTT